MTDKQQSTPEEVETIKQGHRFPDRPDQHIILPFIVRSRWEELIATLGGDTVMPHAYQVEAPDVVTFRFLDLVPQDPETGKAIKSHANLSLRVTLHSAPKRDGVLFTFGEKVVFWKFPDDSANVYLMAGGHDPAPVGVIKKICLLPDNGEVFLSSLDERNQQAGIAPLAPTHIDFEMGGKKLSAKDQRRVQHVWQFLQSDAEDITPVPPADDEQSDQGDGTPDTPDISDIKKKDSITLPVSDTTEAFKVYTGQEVHDWMTAQADGRTFAHWFFDQQAGEARHKRPDSNFMVLIRDRKDLDPVDALIRKQDANTGLAALYVLGVMEIAKYGPLPGGATYTARIDLLDVAKKSGMITRQGKHEREQARARVWGLMQFGARAEVTGARSTTYYDPGTGKTISTRLGGSSLWSLQSIEYPDERGRDEQQKLFPLDDIPLRVRVTLNKDWEPFLFGAHLPQYLRFGEKIGAIPAGKPSGAWAQAMSLCYLHWARVFPRDAKAGKAPTRRELLTKYPPAVGSMDEVSSNGRNQKRIIETYLQALEIMAEEGIIARAGDVVTAPDQQLQGFPSRGWLEPWLNAPANIRPGAEIVQSIDTEILPSLPPERPRALKGKGGRPRKRSSKEKGASPE